MSYSWPCLFADLDKDSIELPNGWKPLKPLDKEGGSMYTRAEENEKQTLLKALKETAETLRTIKFNPYHDSLGRFATGGSGGAGRNLQLSRDILEQTQKDLRERSFLVDRDGKVVSDVSIGEKEENVLESGVDRPYTESNNTEGADLNLIHTHPIHTDEENPYTGLGVGDVLSLKNSPGINSITAIDLDGRVHSITRASDDKEFLKKYWLRSGEIESDLRSKIIDEFIENKITKEEANRKKRLIPKDLIKQLLKEGLLSKEEEWDLLDGNKSYSLKFNNSGTVNA